MKKVFKFCSWTVLLALCIGYSSCSKDDEDNASIVGVWYFQSMTVDIIVNPSDPEAASEEKDEFVLSAFFARINN
jgi:hypothetical protein